MSGNLKKDKREGDALEKAFKEDMSVFPDVRLWSPKKGVVLSSEI